MPFTKAKIQFSKSNKPHKNSQIGSELIHKVKLNDILTSRTERVELLNNEIW